jgi:hypothetical protein
MTAETALALLKDQGFECVGLVLVHTSKPQGAFMWLDDNFPENARQQLLQSELNGTWIKKRCLSNRLV